MRFIIGRNGFNVLVRSDQGDKIVFENVSRFKSLRLAWNYLISDFGFRYSADIFGENISISPGINYYKLASENEIISKIVYPEISKIIVGNSEGMRIEFTEKNAYSFFYQSKIIGTLRKDRMILPTYYELTTNESRKELLISMLAVAVLKVAA